MRFVESAWARARLTAHWSLYTEFFYAWKAQITNMQQSPAEYDVWRVRSEYSQFLNDHRTMTTQVKSQFAEEDRRANQALVQALDIVRDIEESAPTL